MKKGKVILLIIGILFIIVAICFFAARNYEIERQNSFAKFSKPYYYYVKAYGYAAYGFIMAAIPCLIFSFRRNKKED